MSDSPKKTGETIRRKIGRATGKLKSRVGREKRQLGRDLRLEADDVSHRIDRTMRRVEREMRRTSHQVQRTADDLAFEFSDRRDRVEEQLEDLAWQTGRWVRANPTRALLGAFAVGLIAGASAGLCCRRSDDD